MVWYRRFGTLRSCGLAPLILALFFSLPVTLSVHAQTNTTTLSATTSTGIVNESISTGGTGGTGAAVLWTNGGWTMLNEHNSQVETRKDDGHGPTLRQVKKAHWPLTAKDLAPVEYAKMARAVGLDAPAEEAELLQALHDENLEPYPFAIVDSYLYREALKRGTRYRWVWKPLRSQDVKPVAESGATYQTLPEAGYIFPTQYQRKVPMRVLAEMKTLLGCLPNAVFLVSDYEVVHPDPFLAITTPKLLAQGKLWIIDQWDEPGFTDNRPVPVAATVAAR